MNREVAWFKTHRDPLKIPTLIVGGEPMASLTPGREAEECFPRTLLYRVGADLQPTEDLGEAPLAADARETGDGKRGAKLKIAAALLGVGLDTLVRRDDRRRAERRRLVTAGLASLSLALGGLSIFAFTQRDAAVAAKKDAEFQRDEAQSLVEFMLTDLRQRLDAVGRLDILDAVAKRLLESYDKQDLAKLDPDALGRRARVLLLLGEVENTRGNLDAALARYKEAAATTGELLRRAPMSAQQIFDHAQSVFWVGYIAWQRGDAAEAKKQFTQYKDYADQLVAIDSENEDWQAEVDYANSNLGTLAMEQGEATEAVAFFEKSLEVSKELAVAHPDDAERKIALVESYSWLASAQYWLAQFDTAADILRQERLVLDDILAAAPNNQQALDRRQRNQRVAAMVALATGDSKKAELILTAIVNEQRKRIALDPTNIDQLTAFGAFLGDLSDLELSLGRLTEAEEILAAAQDVAKKIDAIDPNIRESELIVSDRNRYLQARLAFAMRDISRSSAVVEEYEARTLLHSATASDQDPNELSLECAFRALKAKIFLLSGDAKGAAAIAQQSVERLERTNNSLNPALLFRLAEAYQLAGGHDRAREISSRLYSRGFRHPDFLKLLEEYPDLKAVAMAGPAAQ